MNIKIKILPISFFPPKAASKVEDKLRTEAAVTEVRQAVNRWMYEG